MLSYKLLDKDKEICYTYDNNGNILTKSVNGEVVEYRYKEDSDQLMSFGNETFAYDVMGNPTTYRGMTAVWKKGKQLKFLNASVNNVGYTHDGKGLRRTKHVGGITTTYTYDSNGKLLKEEGAKTIEYVYGAEGIIGIIIDQIPYLFRKNVFGDVTHIYNVNGGLVGKYSYTAFGECMVDLDINGVASDNPIRYRSYYYDTETSLYYLKTRYYDPEVGRFMTIDDISYLAPDTINGLNLYAYCGNNPVMNVDPTGRAFLTFVIAALVGVAVSFGISAISQSVSDDGNVNWGEATIDGAFGAASGALAMVPGIGAVAMGFLNAGLTALNGVINTTIEKGRNIDLIDGISIAASSLLSGLVGGFARHSFIKSGGREILTEAHNFIGTISKRIVTGVYNNGVDIFSKSFKSAVRQMFGRIAQLNQGFYNDALMGMAQAIFSISFFKGLKNLKW